MYLVPIFTKNIKKSEGIQIKQVWIFLERNGTQCIHVNSLEDAMGFVSINQLPLTGVPILSGPFIFLPVDSKADLSSFYLWSEIRPNEHPMKEVWRSFLWILHADSGEDIWGTNGFLRDISIADSHSVFTIIESYFKTT